LYKTYPCIINIAEHKKNIDAISAHIELFQFNIETKEKEKTGANSIKEKLTTVNGPKNKIDAFNLSILLNNIISDKP
jgi:hypothetical protein